MRIIVSLLLAGVLVLLTAVGYRVYIAESWQASSKARVGIFENEFDAAYQHAQNRPAALPIAVLEPGEHVSVLRDVYGKDYWACYIRTAQRVRGWVLCTSLVPKSA